MHDDVLTSLANIGKLKVISRTSVLSYREKTRSIREIGKALGVTSILEGTVRRSGNRIRLVVQLIDARTDRHIWAQDYDRELTDVFAIQSALAREIAAQLKAKLSDCRQSRESHCMARTLPGDHRRRDIKSALPKARAAGSYALSRTPLRTFRDSACLRDCRTFR